MANWNLDTAHSEIEFRVKHMMITTLKGQFENFDVQFENEGSDFQTAKISAEIDTASISTKNQQRDQHLKSEDFFSADKFPKIKFVSTQINKTAENKYDLIGDLTIKDVTNPVTLQVEYGGI
ncbi:MAG: YceI family protein, partial [Sphingobacterium sp.]